MQVYKLFKIFLMSFLLPTNEIFQQLLYLVHQKTRIKVQRPTKSVCLFQLFITKWNFRPILCLFLAHIWRSTGARANNIDILLNSISPQCSELSITFVDKDYLKNWVFYVNLPPIYFSKKMHFWPKNIVGCIQKREWDKLEKCAWTRKIFVSHIKIQSFKNQIIITSWIKLG